MATREIYYISCVTKFAQLSFMHEEFVSFAHDGLKMTAMVFTCALLSR